LHLDFYIDLELDIVEVDIVEIEVDLSIVDIVEVDFDIYFDINCFDIVDFDIGIDLTHYHLK